MNLERAFAPVAIASAAALTALLLADLLAGADYRLLTAALLAAFLAGLKVGQHLR